MDDSLIKERLLTLEFVYMFFIGISTPKEKRYVDGHEIWCDTYFTAVIQQEDKGVALLGFYLSENALLIEQMQGIKGVNTKGRDLGLLLIAYAEKVARALDRDIVCVKPAYLNIYWELPEDHRLYPQQYAHQDRLRKRYDRSAKQQGYDSPRYGHGWWRKVIRKRLTLVRWWQLQRILFNRSAREKLSFIRQFELVE